jgi:hypothetical protein
MGDLPKPPDDATWSDVERTFFDAAPPEEPQPIGEATRVDAAPPPHAEPRRSQIIGRVRPALAGAWRASALAAGAAGGRARRAWNGASQATKVACRAAGGLVQRSWRATAVFVAAAGVRVRQTARTSAEGLLAAVLSIWCVDRRRVAFAMAGVLIAAGLSAGVVASRRAVPAQGVTAERTAPATGSTVAEAAPVAASPFEPTPPASARSSADVPQSRAAGSNRRAPAHRRSVPASPSTQRPVVTASMDRETYWAHERSAPVRSSGSYFSR